MLNMIVSILLSMTVTELVIFPGNLLAESTVLIDTFWLIVCIKVVFICKVLKEKKAQWNKQLLRKTLLACSQIRWLMLLSVLVRRWYSLMDVKGVRQAESFMRRTWF